MASPPALQYLQYTAICQYGMEHCTVSRWTSYLTSQDATDHGTLGNLLQEGTQDLRVCRILYTVSLDLLNCCLQYTAMCHSAERHVAQASSSVLDLIGCNIARDPR